MVSAAKHANFPKMPDLTMIRDLTAEIRHEWTIGERHYRARMALLLQERLVSRLSCDAPVASAS
jgi:hypothetical protein